MARIIPDLTKQEIIAQHDSEAEARVYAALRDELAQEITVLYSVPWIESSSRGTTRDGETDFVVIDPSHGVLILEVKGGTVEISPGGQWYTRNSGGSLVDITNPFRQGVTSKNVLKREIANIAGIDVSSFIFAHAVALPDLFTDPGNLGTDAPRDLLVLGDEIQEIKERIDDLFGFWSDTESSGLEADQIDLIVDNIFPRQILVPSLAASVQSSEEQIIELTRQQSRFLGFSGNQKRACVEGPAGTGKTVLAFEKAKRLALSGIPTLLTCFSNRLGAKLSEQAESVPNLTAWTFHDTCFKLAEEAGLPPPSPDTKLGSDFFNSTLPGLLWKALDLLPERRFGAVIIDEAQDLKFEWWELLEFVLRNPSEDWLWAFRDPAQDLFAGTTELPEGMTVFTLSENVRNAKNIHDAATPFATGDPGICIGPEGGEVRFEFATNKRAAAKVLSRVLHRLINDEGINREDVVILTASSVQNSSLSGVDHVGSFDLKPLGVDGNGIDVESVWRFKGLERPVVIVTDLTAATATAVRYVAMTRARSVLVMIGDKETK